MEDFDQDAMDRIDEIITNGAMAYFAIENGEVLATCMTMPLENGTWEMCKLAARNQYTETGAGNAVFCACMDYAISKGARRLVLISCTGLKAAIHLYKKTAFTKYHTKKATGNQKKLILKWKNNLFCEGVKILVSMESKSF